MSSNPETISFPAVLAEAEKIATEASATFGRLSPRQINWKRSPGEWSIGQCFDHLLATNRPYLPLLEKIAAGENKRSLWERMPILPRLFGRLVIRAVDPESTRKVKARPAFRPTESEVDALVVNQFVNQQQELMRLMKATGHLELERIVITSPIASIVTYSLLDGYRIIVTHERRHFRQAERVMKAEGFPAQG
jgi:hypothetical protein